MPILDWARGKFLGAIDWLNIVASPFDAFTRELDAVDSAPLPVMADYAWKDIQNNWMFGPEKEFYWHMKPNDLGDMAIWHGFYTAACAFKQDLTALNIALGGLERLQYLGGNSRLARGAGEVGGPQSSDPSRNYYTDGNYVFVDNCSESSLVGYLFGLWATHMTCGDQGTEYRIARMVNDLARQVHADGEVLLNQDGAEAKFGHLRPGLFTAPIRISTLACLYLMADVLGTRLPARERFALAGTRYADILENHTGALTHPETHFLWVHPWYQDMLAYVVLTIQATLGPADKRHLFRESMRMQLRKNEHEGNPFYTYMGALANGIAPFAMVDDATQTLLEFNVTNPLAASCHLPGTVTNSADSSIATLSWGLGKRRRLYARQPVPAYRRPPQDIAWQRCPYSLDGAEAHNYNSMDFALAYYMGRHLHLLP